MRIGLLGERADFFGGGQMSLRDLAVGLSRHGAAEPLVMLPGPGPLAAALEAAGVPWAAVPLPPLGRVFRAVLALALLLTTIRRHRLELLHSDSPRAALFAGLAGRLVRRPHVWHLRSSRPAPALPDRVLLALCDRAIAVSSAVAARSGAARRSAKVRVVPTGIPAIRSLARAEARATLGLPQDVLIAGVIGRVELDKGCAEAAAALPAIRAAAPGALLAFLGPVTSRSMGDGARGTAPGAGSQSGAIRMLGERQEAARFLPAFDLILHPSLHEALPRVLIEALAAGVPVVAAAVGGVPEVIEEGRTGLLVPPRDATALGVAAARLAADPDLRRRLGENGRRAARQRFNFDTMLRRTLGVYEELIPRGQRRSSPATEAIP
jgi:glycosyltransferase involved in cell wall biosynthesis